MIIGQIMPLGLGMIGAGMFSWSMARHSLGGVGSATAFAGGGEIAS